jgi:hypothetical protein
LPAITAADCTSLIVEDRHSAAQHLYNLFGLLYQLFIVLQQRKYTALDRRHARMQPENSPSLRFTFFVGYCLLVVGCTKQRQESAIDSGAWLYHMRNKVGFGFFVEIL